MKRRPRHPHPDSTLARIERVFGQLQGRATVRLIAETAGIGQWTAHHWMVESDRIHPVARLRVPGRRGRIPLLWEMT